MDMNWQDKHAHELGRFVSKNPLPPPYPPGTVEGSSTMHQYDDMRRNWIYRVGQHFRFKFNNPAQYPHLVDPMKWGTKRASWSRPPSTDAAAVAYEDGNPDAGCIAWDLIRAGGSSTQAVNYHPEKLELRDQVFIDVGYGVDHVGDVIVTPPPTHVIRIGATAFWWLGGIRRLGAVGRQTLEDQAHEVKNILNAQFVRVILNLRGRVDDENNPWWHIGLSYTDPEFQSDLQGLCDFLRRWGLKGHFVLAGGDKDLHTSGQRNELVDKSCQVLGNNRDLIELIEMWNEVVNTGGTIDQCKEMAQRCVQNLGTDVLLALSSPPASHMGGDLPGQVAEMHMHAVKVLNLHIQRTGAGANIPPYIGEIHPDDIMSGEPRGIESSVGQTTNPDDIEHDIRACHAARYSRYVFHPDPWIWSEYISAPHKSPWNGAWRILRDHPAGMACMTRVAQLQVTLNGGTQPNAPGGGMQSRLDVAFKTWHGRVMACEPGQAGTIDVQMRDYPIDAVGPWEQWDITALGNDRIALKSHHGGWLRAEGGGGSTIAANAWHTPDLPGEWESFKVERQPDGRIALKCWDDTHYLCADMIPNPAGGDPLPGPLVANRTAVGPWETFEVYPTNWL